MKFFPVAILAAILCVAAVSTAPSTLDEVEDQLNTLLRVFKGYIECFENAQTWELFKIWLEYKPELLDRLDDLEACRNLSGETKEVCVNQKAMNASKVLLKITIGMRTADEDAAQSVEECIFNIPNL